MGQTKFEVVYLHGFASGPMSAKAQFFRKELKALGLNVHVPDLNGVSFADLTITNQLAVVDQTISCISAENDILLIGSSMGGLISVLTAKQEVRVKAMILLAPGFGLNKRWHELLGPEQLKQWKEKGTLDVFNYAVNENVPLKYNFIRDAETYKTDGFIVRRPTLVIHGVHDSVVPAQESEAFAEHNRHTVELHLVDDDHALLSTLTESWQICRSFIERHFE